MKRLLGLLLVMGMVGCGVSVAELEKLGAQIERKRGEVVAVDFLGWDKVTDTGLIHLKGLDNLQKLDLGGTQITDAGLVHLVGLTKLESLDLSRTKITDAGIAELQQALPNCEISKW